MKVFINENGLIDYVEEIKSLPQWKKVYSLKYNAGEGDHDGRDRKRYELEKMYVYYVYSFQSPYRETILEHKHEKAINILELKSNWKPSQELTELIEKVVEIQNLSSTWRMYSNAINQLQRLETLINECVDPKDLSAYILNLPKMNDAIDILEKKFKNSFDENMAIGNEELSEWEK